MRDKPSSDQNVIAPVPLAWRLATMQIRDAAANLQSGNLAEGGRPGGKSSKMLRLAPHGLKVIDFGIARFVGEAFATSIDGPYPDSAAYMSPERCRGLIPDGRSDLYALTCRYYEMLTGETPFKAADVATMLYEHCYTAFPSAALKALDLPDGVIRVLARGSEKDPADRYQSAAEMAGDMTALLELSDSPGKRGAVKPLYADVPVGNGPFVELCEAVCIV